MKQSVDFLLFDSLISLVFRSLTLHMNLAVLSMTVDSMVSIVLNRTYARKFGHATLIPITSTWIGN